jgi:hypothetical protein
MKKTFITLALSALLASGVNAQDATQRTCGTKDAVNNLIQNNPQFAANRANIENFTNNWITEHANDKSAATITIPVVVHVLYNNNTENISDAQVQSQIAVLNKDYRRLNTDASNTPSVWQSISADCGIEFCLATIDPSGNATNGITRTQTNNTSFSINNDNIKFTSQGGKDAWDRNKYLNLWVGDIGQGLLGYAIPPGGPASTDGVVIGYQYFGTIGTASAPFNKGRTATHEIGHWLNLEHIWGDDGNSCGGSDQVADTPNQADENYGCPTFPLTDGCSTTSPGVMFMNYMDYTDDGCMNMFTNGQKTRMLAALNGPRAALLNSTACGGSVNPPPTGDCDTLSNISGADNLLVYGAVDGNQAPAGYISGTNTYNDNAKADKFTTTSGMKVTGGLFLFGRAYTTNNTRKVTAAVWDATGTAGAPGTELANKDILINSITEGSITAVTFTNTPTVPTAFYMGIRWTGLAATDSVALYTNTDGESTPNTAWERWSDNTWYAYDDADSWGLSVSHAIFPVLCPTVQSVEETQWEGVSVFPNPTDGNINVYLKLKSNDDVFIRVFNPVGQLITSQTSSNSSGGTYNFDLNSQAPGLYFVEVNAGNLTKTFKILVAR